MIIEDRLVERRWQWQRHAVAPAGERWIDDFVDELLLDRPFADDAAELADERTLESTDEEVGELVEGPDDSAGDAWEREVGWEGCGEGRLGGRAEQGDACTVMDRTTRAAEGEA